jgi:hypothetical protein
MEEDLLEHERALLHTLMFKAGLIPIDASHHDMRRALNQLPHDEARAVKRKFRKAWRKLVKSLTSKVTSKRKKILEEVYGVGKKNPSRSARQARKQAVLQHFLKIVEPIINGMNKRQQ